MIAIGSDHGGYALKERIIRHLKEAGIPCEDLGCHSTESCDYPVYGHAVAQAVAEGRCEKGIVVCTTGIGIAISANRHLDGQTHPAPQRCQHAGAGRRHSGGEPGPGDRERLPEHPLLRRGPSPEKNRPYRKSR